MEERGHWFRIQKEQRSPGRYRAAVKVMEEGFSMDSLLAWESGSHLPVTLWLTVGQCSARNPRDTNKPPSILSAVNHCSQ